MALDFNPNTAASSFQDITRTAQNLTTASTAANTQTDMAVASRILQDQQKNSNDGNQQKEDPSVNAQRIKNAVNQANDMMNDKMKHARTGCEFSYNEEVNRIYIKVYDKDTNEVIREIPSEESLKAFEKVLEIAGLLVDEKR
jgi:flagellar protein FlaG